MNGFALQRMMDIFKRHRDYQRRFHMLGASYFLTSKTHQSFPFFTEPIFCDLFVENLRLCRALLGFRLYGWVLCPDHFHLLVQPEGQWNISDIMRFLKRNTARNINFLMGLNECDEPIEGRSPKATDLRNDGTNYGLKKWHLTIESFIQCKWVMRYRFKIKYINENPFPKFRWQERFHDHYIRNRRDFLSHLKYIDNNPIKHNLPEGWPHVFTNPDHNHLFDNF